MWFPGEYLVPREGFEHKPLLWRLEWPQYIIDKLVTEDNPSGTISNSDLELAGGLLHLEAQSQVFDIRERTILSKTDNLNTLFWQRKGSASTEKVPAHLLRLFGIHQRFHRYVPRHDYLSGPSNPVADALSRDFNQSWEELTQDLSPYLPTLGSQIWTPSEQIVSAVLDALVKQQSRPESLLIPPAMPTTSRGARPSICTEWPSIPYSKPSRTKYQAYRSSNDEFVLGNLNPVKVASGMERLKITYGTLPRRPSVWGPKPHTKFPTT